MTRPPKKFKGAALADFPNDTQRDVRLWLQDPADLMTLTGDPGVGKTRLAWAILLECSLPDPRDAEFWKSTELLLHWQSIVSAFGMHELERELKRMSRMKSLLVIDDLGCEKLTEFGHQGLVLLFSVREERELPTIVTTNATMQEIADSIDARVASRLDGGVVLEMGGKDRR